MVGHAVVCAALALVTFTLVVFVFVAPLLAAFAFVAFTLVAFVALVCAVGLLRVWPEMRASTFGSSMGRGVAGMTANIGLRPAAVPSPSLASGDCPALRPRPLAFAQSQSCCSIVRYPHNLQVLLPSISNGVLLGTKPTSL